MILIVSPKNLLYVKHDSQSFAGEWGGTQCLQIDGSHILERI